MSIHPTAIIASGAKVSGDVHIGPYCCIGENVTLESGVELGSHVVLENRAWLRQGVKVSPFSTIGLAPQDTRYKGELTGVDIREGSIIREHVTIHAGTPQGKGITTIGPECMIMVSAHVAHDCTLGRGVIMANNATLGGHVTVGDYAIIGGLAAVHQFTRIGEMAIVSGTAGVADDVIPFGSVIGSRAQLTGLNVIGLRRRGISREELHGLRKAYRHLFLTEVGVMEERIKTLPQELRELSYVRTVIAFLQDGGKRPLCLPRRGKDEERVDEKIDAKDADHGNVSNF